MVQAQKRFAHGVGAVRQIKGRILSRQTKSVGIDAQLAQAIKVAHYHFIKDLAAEIHKSQTRGRKQKTTDARTLALAAENLLQQYKSQGNRKRYGDEEEEDDDTDSNQSS